MAPRCESRDASGVDDRAAPGRAHQGDCGLHAVEGSHQVYIEDTAKVFWPDIVDAGTRSGDPSVVDRDIDASAPLREIGVVGLYRVVVGDVEHHRDNFGPTAAE